MNLENIMLCKISQTKKGKNSMIPLRRGIELHRTQGFSQAHVRRRKGARERRGDGAGGGELVFNAHRVFVWDDPDAVEMDGGDGCTTVGLYLMPLNCAPKVVKRVNSIYTLPPERIETHFGCSIV